MVNLVELLMRPRLQIYICNCEVEGTQCSESETTGESWKAFTNSQPMQMFCSNNLFQTAKMCLNTTENTLFFCIIRHKQIKWPFRFIDKNHHTNSNMKQQDTHSQFPIYTIMITILCETIWDTATQHNCNGGGLHLLINGSSSGFAHSANMRECS